MCTPPWPRLDKQLSRKYKLTNRPTIFSSERLIERLLIGLSFMNMKSEYHFDPDQQLFRYKHKRYLIVSFFGNVKQMTHSVLKGGGQKNVFFRENQRFVLVNWVKLLDVQPWGPHLSDGEQNYGQKTAICGHI